MATVSVRYGGSFRGGTADSDTTAQPLVDGSECDVVGVQVTQNDRDKPSVVFGIPIHRHK